MCPHKCGDWGTISGVSYLMGVPEIELRFSQTWQLVFCSVILLASLKKFLNIQLSNLYYFKAIFLKFLTTESTNNHLD